MTPTTLILILKKSESKNKTWLIIFAVLTALVMAFIFSNSLQPPNESNSRSRIIADWLYGLPLLRQWLTEDDFHAFIRKIAHFTEFAALGLCLGGFAYNLGRIKAQKYISLPMLVALATAVTDEFIQRFTGRTSSVKDVLIDFSGALCGLAVTWIISSVKKRRQENG